MVWGTQDETFVLLFLSLFFPLIPEEEESQQPSSRAAYSGAGALREVGARIPISQGADAETERGQVTPHRHAASQGIWARAACLPRGGSLLRG